MLQRTVFGYMKYHVRDTNITQLRRRVMSRTGGYRGCQSADGLGTAARSRNIIPQYGSSWPCRAVLAHITGLSVAVALIIGSVELLGLLAEQLGWRCGFWDWITRIDLNTVGFVIVGLLVVTWVTALLIWRVGRIEARWTARSDSR